MLICIEKSTGRLLEMQSDATPGTLIRNAIAQGFTTNQVEERTITLQAYEASLPPLPPPEPTIQDIISVLSSDQQIAIQTAVNSNLLTETPIIG